MANTLIQAIEYVRTHKVRDVVENGRVKLMSWSGYCESLVSRASDTPWRGTALEASRASKIEGNEAAGPRGSFGFASGVFVDGRDAGHVWINLGDDLALMASSRVSNRLGGGDAGIVNIHWYMSQFPRMRTIGWSWDHCGVRLAPEVTLAPTNSEENELNAEEKTMLQGIYDLLKVPNQPYGFPAAADNKLNDISRLLGPQTGQDHDFGWNTLDVTRAHAVGAYNQGAEVLARLGALSATVERLAAGGDVSPEAIREAAEAGARAALESASFVVSPTTVGGKS